jgi:hypothetical protein
LDAPQIDAALFAILDALVGLRTALRTKHNAYSIFQFACCFACWLGKCRVSSSVTLGAKLLPGAATLLVRRTGSNSSVRVPGGGAEKTGLGT